MTTRAREYTIYARSPGEGFTTRSACYSAGTHRWIYLVYATSIRQAYALAHSRTFAADPRSVGVRTLECDWWHRHDRGNAYAEAHGERFVAPYLRGEREEQ